MSEVQYKDYDKLPRHTLGLMSNEVWDRDPKMLGIHLARYKFVAKMLTGKKRVAEIGCGDGFYSRVVEKEVNELDLYDLDPSMCDKAMACDITTEHLPGEYNAIYSLDCFEHIKQEGMDRALRCIQWSLTDRGVFIVGMPSLESQTYASEASKIGHVNCKSGEDLKHALEQYFHNVFLFSMHDEVITTAFSPMAHYLICVCAGVR